MKSSMFILPFTGFALAQSQCGPRQTVTETQVQKITVTVPAASAVAEATHAVSSIASRVKSHHPQFSHYPFGNGTFNHTSRFPTNLSGRPTTLATQTSVLAAPSSVSLDAVTLIVSPSPVEAPSSSGSAVIPTSEASAAAVIPTSKASAAASSTVASAAAPSATSSPADSVSAVQGTATFYGGNVAGGHCSFSGYTLPSGLFGTAFGAADSKWDASHCGQCVSVTGPNGKSIKAMVTDECPECTNSHLDLFQDAFASIGNIKDGVIDVSYSVVPCEITSPIILKNKEGTSAYWFSMQVVNSNVAVTDLEVSTDGGATWTATTRSEYNYFENPSGFGTETVDVRVTSVGGNTVTVKDVSVAASTSKTASSNFDA